MKCRVYRVLSRDVPGIIRQGSGGGCCACKTRPVISRRGSGNLCAARRITFNTANFLIICQGSRRWSEANLLSRFASSQGRYW